MTPDRREPELLVSVRSVQEARRAQEGGADIIDVKEPSHGSLGKANADVVREILAESAKLSGRWSFALGELSEAEQDLAELRSLFPAGGPRPLAKVGFAGETRRSDWDSRFLALSQRLSDCVHLIPAAYADAERAEAPSVPSLCELAIRASSPYLLIDTWRKDGRGLFAWMNVSELTAARQTCDGAGVRLALAGSLTLDDFPAVLSVAPAVVAVRGAACAGNQRLAEIHTDRVRELKQRLTPGAAAVIPMNRPGRANPRR